MTTPNDVPAAPAGSPTGGSNRDIVGDLAAALKQRALADPVDPQLALAAFRDEVGIRWNEARNRLRVVSNPPDLDDEEQQARKLLFSSLWEVFLRNLVREMHA